VGDLGGLVGVHRSRASSWRVLVLAIVLLPLVFITTRELYAVALAAGGLVAIVLLARRIRLEVREEGIVVGGFISSRRYRWHQITAFSPMPLSTGKPGISAAVVVDGVNHEILVLHEPGLYQTLRRLNEMMLRHQASTDPDHTSPLVDGSRSDWMRTRNRTTLWLGPGAAWWPRRYGGEPPRDAP
jgi:hypothetical protein